MSLSQSSWISGTVQFKHNLLYMEYCFSQNGSGVLSRKGSISLSLFIYSKCHIHISVLFFGSLSMV